MNIKQISENLSPLVSCMNLKMLNNLIFIKATYHKTIQMRAKKGYKNKLLI